MARGLEFDTLAKRRGDGIRTKDGEQGSWLQFQARVARKDGLQTEGSMP